MMTMGGDQNKGGGMQINEEQVYAEPILVNHRYHTSTTLSSSSGGTYIIYHTLIIIQHFN